MLAKAELVNPNKLNDRGQNALHLAARSGNTGTVHALLDAGAQLDLQDEDGQSALHLAAPLGHVEVVDALLHAGAKVDLLNKNNLTASHNLLLGAHVRPWARPHEGGSSPAFSWGPSGPGGGLGWPGTAAPLVHRGSCVGYLPQVHIALLLGAQPDLQDVHGSTALHCASKKDHVEVVRLLQRGRTLTCWTATASHLCTWLHGEDTWR